ncbi:MAG: DNA-processing protein DprA [Candidatus Omnitrophica bacterium]|nr:DNA-processing protein DprA [Candidatus Omnitrophota bacterium]MDD5775262.1 DNA-processing protein DprA [Candidatus Omnitrophota bacterium]
MTRTEALIALNLSMDIGSIRLQRLLDVFGSPEAVVGAPAGELARVPGIGAKIAQDLSSLGRSGLEQELALIAKHGLDVITLHDDAYPGNLRYTVDKPIVLYVKGAIAPSDVLSIAMVGCRSPSLYGIEQAERFARDCAERGITVISGMARGIDTRSHEGALKAGGRTLAVIGSGLGNVYPPENEALAQRIARSGAVISEFPVSTGPRRFNFPRRNRIISGLSLGVLVIEAGRNSGSLITAHCALDQGRDVFALPGRIDTPQAYGTNALIKDGACPVSCIEDMIENMPFLSLSRPSGRGMQGPQRAPSGSLSCLEEALYNIISHHPVSMEVLMEQTHMGVIPLSSVLVDLQMKHMITQVAAGTYIRSSYAR